MSVIVSDIKLQWERASGITLSDIMCLISDDLYLKKSRDKSGCKVVTGNNNYVWTVLVCYRT